MLFANISCICFWNIKLTYISMVQVEFGRWTSNCDGRSATLRQVGYESTCRGSTLHHRSATEAETTRIQRQRLGNWERRRQLASGMRQLYRNTVIGVVGPTRIWPSKMADVSYFYFRSRTGPLTLQDRPTGCAKKTGPLFICPHLQNTV